MFKLVEMRNMRLWRRPLFATALAVACVGFAADKPALAAGCTNPDEIRVMYFASVINQMVTYIAQDEGFFEKNCLKATLVPVNTGPAGLAQLQSGSLQFADSSFDNVLVAREKGLPVKVVAGESSGIPYSLVVRHDLKLAHEAEGYPAVMQDLVGKRIGVFGLGTGSEGFVKALVRGAGLDPEKIVYVAVGSTPTQLAALANNAVDAVIMADPAQDLASQSNYGRIIVDMRKPDVGPAEIRNLVGTFQVKVTSEALLAEKPDMVARYVKANEETAAWIKDEKNFDRLFAHMQQHVKLGDDVKNADEVLRKMVKQYAGFASAAASRRSVAAWNAFQQAAGKIKAPVAFDSVIWSGTPTTD